MKRNILLMLGISGLLLLLGIATSGLVSIGTESDGGDFPLLEGWSYEGKLIDEVYLFDVTVVILDDGRYHLYGEASDIGNHTVVSYISTDGLNFTIEDGYRLTGAFMPFAVKLANGSFRLYYTDQTGDPPSPGARAIMSAVSDDGLNFTVDEGDRLTYNGSSYESSGIRGGKILQLDNGTYRMYYHGIDGDSHWRVLSAVSENGLNWTREAGVRLDPSDLCDGVTRIGNVAPLITSNGTFHLYVSALVCTGDLANGIFDTTSADGLTFTAGSTPVINSYGSESEGTEVTPEDPAAIITDGGIRMYFAPYGTQGYTIPESGIYSVFFNGTSYTTTTTTLDDDECPLVGDDEPCDGTVSDFELLAYIEDWVLGEVTDFDLLEAIENWAGTTTTTTTTSTTTSTSTTTLPEFTSHIVGLDNISYIVPSGSVSGDIISPHSYLSLNANVSMTDVYAPMAAQVDSIGYWISDNQTTYQVFFKVNDTFFYFFDHLQELSPEIDAAAPQEPLNTSAGADPTSSVSVQAGDLVGRTEGTYGARTFDFGVYDLLHNNTVANPERYSSSDRYLHGLCPYDLYSDEMKAGYSALFGSLGGILVPGSECRNPSRDVPGTASGMWYLDSGSNDTYGSQFALASTLDGSVRWGGVSPGTHEDAISPTDPANITAGESFCYSDAFNPDTYLFVKLLSATELAVSYNSGDCPESFPDSYVTYLR